MGNIIITIVLGRLPTVHMQIDITVTPTAKEEDEAGHETLSDIKRDFQQAYSSIAQELNTIRSYNLELAECMRVFQDEFSARPLSSAISRKDSSVSVNNQSSPCDSPALFRDNDTLSEGGEETIKAIGEGIGEGIGDPILFRRIILTDPESGLKLAIEKKKKKFKLVFKDLPESDPDCHWLIKPWQNRTVRKSGSKSKGQLVYLENGGNCISFKKRDKEKSVSDGIIEGVSKGRRDLDRYTLSMEPPSTSSPGQSWSMKTDVKDETVTFQIASRGERETPWLNYYSGGNNKSVALKRKHINALRYSRFDAGAEANN